MSKNKLVRKNTVTYVGLVWELLAPTPTIWFSLDRGTSIQILLLQHRVVPMVIFRGWETCVKTYGFPYWEQSASEGSMEPERGSSFSARCPLPFWQWPLVSPLTEKGHLFIYFPAFRDTGLIRGNVHEWDLIPMRGAIPAQPHNP